MNTLILLKLSHLSSIQILVATKNKKNYYYEPTEKLHMFDEVTITYQHKDETIQLFKDILNDAITLLNNSLIKAIGNKRQLPAIIKPGELGNHYEKNKLSLNEIDYAQFWLWSKGNVQTWLYNQADTIYLEISLSTDLSQKKKNTLSNTLVALFKITPEQAVGWIDECNSLKESMITV